MKVSLVVLGPNFFANTSYQGRVNAQQGLSILLQALAEVGLAIEIRNGDYCSLLIFVKIASDKRLRHEVYKSRLAFSIGDPKMPY